MTEALTFIDIIFIDIHIVVVVFLCQKWTTKVSPPRIGFYCAAHYNILLLLLLLLWGIAIISAVAISAPQAFCSVCVVVILYYANELSFAVCHCRVMLTAQLPPKHKPK